MQFTVVCSVKNNAALSHSSLARIHVAKALLHTYTACTCCVIEILRTYVRIVYKRASAHGGIKNHLVIV